MSAGHAPVAQWIERLTTDQKVGGSSPPGRAILFAEMHRGLGGAKRVCGAGAARAVPPIRVGIPARPLARSDRPANNAPISFGTVFAKDRERLPAADLVAGFMPGLLGQARVKVLQSDEQFLVGGPLIEAWASKKRVRPEYAGGDASPPRPPSRARSPSWATCRCRTAPAWGRRPPALATATAEHQAVLAVVEDGRARRRRRRARNEAAIQRASSGLARAELQAACGGGNLGRRSAVDAPTSRRASYRARRIIRARIEEVFPLGVLLTVLPCGRIVRPPGARWARATHRMRNARRRGLPPLAGARFAGEEFAFIGS